MLKYMYINKSNCPFSGPSLRFTDTPGFHSPFFFSSSISPRPMLSERLGQARVSEIRLLPMHLPLLHRFLCMLNRSPKKRYDIIQHCRKRHKDRVKNESKWLNAREVEKPEEFSRYTPNFVFNIAIFS